MIRIDQKYKIDVVVDYDDPEVKFLGSLIGGDVEESAVLESTVYCFGDRLRFIDPRNQKVYHGMKRLVREKNNFPMYDSLLCDAIARAGLLDDEFDRKYCWEYVRLIAFMSVEENDLFECLKNIMKNHNSWEYNKKFGRINALKNSVFNK
jgi:hypothetical protein